MSLIIIGLTGGAASGKSTLASALSAAGFLVINCDKLWHKLMEPGAEGYKQVVAEFGSSIVDASSGKVDRAALGAKVFGDKDAANRLNAIAWPAVAAKVRELCAAIASRIPAETETSKVVFIEAAMLTQAGWHNATPRLLDEVWGIWTDEALQCRRIVHNRGKSVAAASAIIASQPKPWQMLKHCNIAISNITLPQNMIESGLALAKYRAACGMKSVWSRTGPHLCVVGVPPPRAWLDQLRPPPPTTVKSAASDSRDEISASSASDPGAASDDDDDGEWGTAKVDVEEAKRLSAAERILIVDEDNEVVGGALRHAMRVDRLWHRATYVFIHRTVLRTTGLPQRESSADSMRMDVEERYLVHRRTDWKDYCPGMMDTNNGGVVGEFEAGFETDSAARELAEEVGLGASYVSSTENTLKTDPDVASSDRGRGKRLPDRVPRVHFSMASDTPRARVWGVVADYDADNEPSCHDYDDEVDSDDDRDEQTWTALAGPKLHLQATEVAAAHWLTPEEIFTAASAGTPAAEEWTDDGIAFLKAYLEYSDTGAVKGHKVMYGNPPGRVTSGMFGTGSSDGSESSSTSSSVIIGLSVAAAAVAIGAFGVAIARHIEASGDDPSWSTVARAAGTVWSSWTTAFQ